MSVKKEPTHVTARLHATIMQEVIRVAVMQVTVEMDTLVQVTLFDLLRNKCLIKGKIAPATETYIFLR